MTDFDCIVSLTTWRGRIAHPDVCKAVYSIIRQKTKYKFKIVLTLSEEEFPEHDIPETLALLIYAGNIEIIWTKDNLRAYKKYYYVHKKYPNAIIITTDDDILLSQNAVELMMDFYQEHKNCICAQHLHTFETSDEQVAGWFRLYPPNSLLDIDKDFFIHCFNTLEDDVYNAILASLKHTKSVKTPFIVAQEMRGSLQNCAFRNVYTKTDAHDYKRKLIYALHEAGIL